MSELHPIEPKPANIRSLECEEWETLLADALDGTLPPGDSKAFHYHSRTCSRCAEMLSQASLGREWLQFLHAAPAAPADLVAKILSRTSGSLAASPGAVDGMVGAVHPIVPAPVPFWKRMAVPPMLRRFAEPRLMMTAAMAFFSVTLTLNLAGVRLSAIRLADLTPSNMSLNIDRQYHMASARVVRYYDNLRFVYEMEARVRELRRNAELDDPSSQQKQKQAQPAPQSRQSNPRKSGGKSEGQENSQPRDLQWGKAIEAGLRSHRADEQPSGAFSGGNGDDLKNCADQAERGLA